MDVNRKARKHAQKQNSLGGSKSILTLHRAPTPYLYRIQESLYLSNKYPKYLANTELVYFQTSSVRPIKYTKGQTWGNVFIDKVGGLIYCDTRQLLYDVL